MTKILIGANPEGKQVEFDLKMATRHGIISGATGTGKTVTLQVLAEHFSKNGVPVFTADVKGDLSGLSTKGTEHKKIDERINKINITDFSFRRFPTVFWDLHQEMGHPIRTTISSMGPTMISRLIELNNTQTDILHMAFKIADDQGLLLLDLKDLVQLIKYVGVHNKDLQEEYGNISKASTSAIVRKLLTLGEEGAEIFFGEPEININQFLTKDFSNNGLINILDATKLVNDKRLYGTFLLFLLSELFEELEESGDSDKPKLVFFFDEAHLLFKDAPKALVEKIETVVKLIRSKGVGVFFVTQNPADIPDIILSQLGNRFQHALRAFTPNEKKAVKVAAKSFRENPKFDTEQEILNLSIGEALVSVLDEDGSPTIVEKTLICPPNSKMGSVSDEDKIGMIKSSPIYGQYEKTLDRESAYEKLKARREIEIVEEEKEAEEKKKSKRQSVGEAFLKSVTRSIGSQLSRSIVRGILGSFKK